MKLSIVVATMTCAATCGRGFASPALPATIPEINVLMDKAFPKWEIDENHTRKEWKPCTVASCEWNPFYTTARWDSLHPDFGGHPTDNDVKYLFLAAAPFLGQPYAGTAQHCALNAPMDVKMKDCPKIEPLTDDGPDGPGHIPPHIALLSLKKGVLDKLYSFGEMFDHENFGCRVVPDVLFKMIRHYFPRTAGEKVAYPKPYTIEGGDYQYEFPAGNGVDNQGPPYAPGSSHWCTDEFLATGLSTTFCPYVYEGPDAGKYRRPHIAFASLEVHLANLALPGKCATTWLENNPDYLNNGTTVPTRVTTDKPFPTMTNEAADRTTVENWIGQPVLSWQYDSGPAKDAEVMLANVTRSYLNFDDTVTAATTVTVTATTVTATTTTVIANIAVASGAVTVATGSATALMGSVLFLAYM